MDNHLPHQFYIACNELGRTERNLNPMHKACKVLNEPYFTCMYVGIFQLISRDIEYAKDLSDKLLEKEKSLEVSNQKYA